MTQEERKRWWRLAATAVVGGGLAVVGWVQFIHPATAEQIPTADVSFGDRSNAEPGQWYRSSNSISKPVAQSSEEIVRVSGTLPQNTNVNGPVVPTFPVNSEAPISPPAGVYAAGPRSFDSGLVGNASQLPAIPAVPDPAAMPSAAPSPLPAIPSMSPLSVGPSSDGGNLPVLPVIPVPTPTMSNSLAPDLSPGITGVSPSTNLTPSTPPSKFPDTIQPIIPVQPDSRLPSRNEGITVKTENPQNGGWVQAFPNSPAALPVPGIVQPSNPAIPSIPVVGNNEETYGKVVDRPKAIEGTLPHSEKYTLPLPVPNSTKTSTSGDNTMFSFHQQTAALAMIGGLFLAPTNVGAKDDKTDIAELKTKVDEANKKLADMQKDLQKLTELLSGKKDAQGFVIPSDPGVVAQLKTLKDNLATIAQDLEKLKAQTSTSLKPITITPVPETKIGRGTVRIVNEYPVQISMVVNGTSYQVQPSKAVDVDVTAGEFSYQLLQSGAAVTHRPIKDKETVTLHVK
jgi:hypothetical protein